MIAEVPVDIHDVVLTEKQLNLAASVDAFQRLIMFVFCAATPNCMFSVSLWLGMITKDAAGQVNGFVAFLHGAFFFAAVPFVAVTWMIILLREFIVKYSSIKLVSGAMYGIPYLFAMAGGLCHFAFADTTSYLTRVSIAVCMIPLCIVVGYSYCFLIGVPAIQESRLARSTPSFLPAQILFNLLIWGMLIQWYVDRCVHLGLGHNSKNPQVPNEWWPTVSFWCLNVTVPFQLIRLVTFTSLWANQPGWDRTISTLVLFERSVAITPRRIGVFILIVVWILIVPLLIFVAANELVGVSLTFLMTWVWTFVFLCHIVVWPCCLCPVN